MRPLEDEIRDTLRSEAGRLREVRPLQLPPVAAPREPRAVPHTPRGRRLRAWLAPAAAVAVVVLVAATLVTLKSLRNGHTAAPAASPGPNAGPAPAAGATPRYYVELGVARNVAGWAIIAGDKQAGKTIATYPLHVERAIRSSAASGAADDRTFVVSAASFQGTAVPPIWYLVRIFPGSADPVRITKLPIEFPADEEVTEIALSGDGTELAVVSMTPGASHWPSDVPHTLRVYSVATGRLQHSWSADISEAAGNLEPIADLSWVGDSTVGFAVTYIPEVREEVRTLNIGAAGTDLLADSRVVWSQYVPAAPHKTVNAPHASDTPFLTGNGQAVVCGNGIYSPSDKRLSALWLAYPLATPTRPHVIGSIQVPKGVEKLDGSISVDWTNSSGSEVIGSWNTTVDLISHGEPAQETTNYEGVIENGKVKPFPPVLGARVAW